MIRQNEPLAPYTTFGIEGVAEHFVEACSRDELMQAVAYARVHQYAVTIIAGGSNVVCAPIVKGLVIKVALKGVESINDRVRVGAGESLLETITILNAKGLAGLEALAGIPGTVGGAIVGNAGAYGTEIGSRVVSVEVMDGVLDRRECHFGYRSSFFKEHRDLVVLSVELVLQPGDPTLLQKKSAEIIQKREEKYPRGLRCPGSFFKNLVFDELHDAQKKMIDPEHVVYGKVPAGYLIEAVGGKGVCVGQACVANYHGNLLVNTGRATYAEVRELADMLRNRVFERFGVELKEEIRYIS
ncbi:MAG: UDP-N-acetylmuramate dehydrogenase [bacterium]|nr:UDP-N-acetylmuramate dehydrogenase [bacterium]